MIKLPPKEFRKSARERERGRDVERKQLAIINNKYNFAVSLASICGE